MITVRPPMRVDAPLPPERPVRSKAREPCPGCFTGPAGPFADEAVEIRAWMLNRPRRDSTPGR
jgi:hypothetical protein